MAEVATIARPYAQALFQASAAAPDAACGWLDELVVVAAHAALREFADSPKASSAQVFDLIVAVLPSELPLLAQNFLRTVIDNGRLAALPEIAAQFHELKNAQQGVFDAVVHSAFEIDPAALQDLSGVLEKRFGRKLKLQVELQPDLIGGIRVVVGDEVLDTSIKARLQQMKTALTA
ncbi:F0F1 ATP synthase subunit delta [Hydrogenophaga sp.]|uniref:F0F1 ATP synthase subunit delta n=1 Tax=Hydrogenophaga sp. TaxID=1904254 RepID=UPI00199C417E|nr:F0F1 ATP synthase subunit delta [Hydrogenophaga sp.]MBD3893020.1 F0F1 ATP synthase subunit delta [Hydrogenophaga sp.]